MTFPLNMRSVIKYRNSDFVAIKPILVFIEDTTFNVHFLSLKHYKFMRTYSCSCFALVLFFWVGGFECLAIHLSQIGSQWFLGQFASWKIKLGNVPMSKKRGQNCVFADPYWELIFFLVYMCFVTFPFMRLFYSFCLKSQVCLKDNSNKHIENFLCVAYQKNKMSFVYFCVIRRTKCSLFSFALSEEHSILYSQNIFSFSFNKFQSTGLVYHGVP